MFINLSNHPSSGWPQKELEAASAFGRVMDIPFPAVAAGGTEEEVLRLAAGYLKKIPAEDSGPVMVTGEYSFVYALVDALVEKGRRVVCPQADVRVSSTPGLNGASERKLVFDFRRFVDYERYPGVLEPVKVRRPIFLNCSTHYASSTWDERAREMAGHYGEIVDLPVMPLSGSGQDRLNQADRYLEAIDRIGPSAVLLDGEFCTFYMLANALYRKGCTVLVKCSSRDTVERQERDGTVTKITQYRFVRYRRVRPLGG